MTPPSETLAQRLRLGPLSDREATQLCRALRSAIEAAPQSHGAIRTDTILLQQGRPTLLAAGAAPGSSEAALYAIASVLYEALTGRPWAAGADPAAADWSGVPRRLQRVLLRAFNPAPERRWQDAAEAFPLCGIPGFDDKAHVVRDQCRTHLEPLIPEGLRWLHVGWWFWPHCAWLSPATRVLFP